VDQLQFLPPEYDRGTTLLNSEEAERYLALDEWARDLFGDDPRMFLDDGYAPRDRWYRLEHAYARWVEVYPDDAVDLPGNPPFDLGNTLFLFGD
jgi:hypothetical protein